MRGKQPNAYFKTACFVKYLCSLLMDFHETSMTSITGIPLMSTIEMRGNNPILTSKLYSLLNISAPCWHGFS